ncbi:hypothetical protein H6F93_05105 [Leptolyngbya sp. FACHB-671]|uniref:hypothetical protein n=1 Tax=Leptolyngbya sp. FACHB-671 TaxID=2692812 RepID=UPI001689F2BA|nr:hypothetical protein [Leptolyngbya sp. FACHB-671]MBD2066914.1 hypothetical protein [Leptolyngbya sp. FACHB-671]
MLSLFAYGLTYGQAEAVSEITRSEPSSSRTATRTPEPMNQGLKQDLESNSTYLNEQILELQQNYYLERREFL